MRAPEAFTTRAIFAKSARSSALNASGLSARGSMPCFARRSRITGTSTYAGNWGVISGTYGVDVRNSDGLIVVSDMTTGFWAIKMDGFDGWNGHQWGMPNVSGAQDWDNGPDGAPKPQRVSRR